MSYMEMFVALLAVILFASVSVMMNRAMLEQYDLLVNASAYLQASHLNHSILDEIDSKLFSKQLAFKNITTQYNTTRTLNLQHNGGTYNVQIAAAYSDSLGVPLTTPEVNMIYVRVRTTTTTAGLNQPVVMQRVYTKTHLNL
ncbi:MAG TPA: hypothetical protein PKH19_00965 [Candidatus Syntrophosphaera sp.]|nr:hypothetical protein [Candidatus Syntrophosphaera sp.]